MPVVDRVLEFAGHSPGDVLNAKARLIYDGLYSFPHPYAGISVTSIYFLP